MMNTANTNMSGKRLDQYATLEYILLGDLRDLLEDSDDEVTCKWLLAVLEALLDTLPREFDLEEQGGYLAEVLENYPNWVEEVDRLRSQHESLFNRLAELRQQILGRTSYAAIADQLRRDLRDWMMTLIAHHRHENRLLQTALNLEVGVGD